MTVKELSQLRYLKREIERDEERLVEMEGLATSTTARITGLPRIKGVADKTALAAGIADIKEEIQAKKQMCLTEYLRLMSYIKNIKDSNMRQIFTLRYINEMSWIHVAAHIGGNNTEDSVRMAHNRFLKK